MSHGAAEAKATIERAANALADGADGQGFDESHMKAILDAGSAHDAAFIMHLANHRVRREARG